MDTNIYLDVHLRQYMIVLGGKHKVEAAITVQVNTYPIATITFQREIKGRGMLKRMILGISLLLGSVAPVSTMVLFPSTQAAAEVYTYGNALDIWTYYEY